MKWIQSLSYEEQKKLWVCNDKIARQNAERFAHMDLHNNLTPALLAYDGMLASGGINHSESARNNQSQSV